MRKYSFKGTVSHFGKVVINNFCTETMAISQAKATSNILCQAKKTLNLVPSAGGVSIQGTITAE